jgi:hypothetical protein
VEIATGRLAGCGAVVTAFERLERRSRQQPGEAGLVEAAQAAVACWVSHRREWWQDTTVAAVGVCTTEKRAADPLARADAGAAGALVEHNKGHGRRATPSRAHRSTSWSRPRGTARGLSTRYPGCKARSWWIRKGIGLLLVIMGRPCRG